MYRFLNGTHRHPVNASSIGRVSAYKGWFFKNCPGESLVAASYSYIILRIKKRCPHIWGKTVCNYHFCESQSKGFKTKMATLASRLCPDVAKSWRPGVKRPQICADPIHKWRKKNFEETPAVVLSLVLQLDVRDDLGDNLFHTIWAPTRDSAVQDENVADQIQK